MGVISGALAMFRLTRPGMLFGITPDVAAWFGGAIRLVHGALPYRDFVYTEPPGFMLLTSPFAALSTVIGTRDALALLRLTTPLIAMATVVIAGRLVRHRGTTAVIVTCAIAMLLPAQLYALRGPQLEPVAALLVLIAAALLFDGDRIRSRRVVIAGAILGVAIAVKLTALLPVLAIAVLCMRTPRNAARLLSAAAAAFAVLAAPFVITAPAAFVTDVLVTPAVRVGGSTHTSIATRLADLTGAPPGLGVAVVALLGVFVVVALLVTARKPSPLERFAAGTCVVVTLAQVLPSAYYPQYAALGAPFLALTLGLVAARLAERRRELAVVVLAASAAALAAATAQVGGESVPDVAAAVDAAVPAGACALTDGPALLVTSNRFVAAHPGCNVFSDPDGIRFALGTTPQAVTAWRTAFASATYVVTDTPIGRWPLPARSISADVLHHFRLRERGTVLVYVRTSAG